MKLKSTILIFLGPPGSGKGTQAQMLVQKFGLNYFAPGDAVREIVSTGNDAFAKAVKKRYENGEPQPDDVIYILVKRKLESIDLSTGIILDPYPLSKGQSEDFMKLKTKFQLPDPLVIYVRVGEEEVVKRLSKRKFCKKCNETHLPLDASYAENKCKSCGGELYTRPDDVEEIVRVRYKKYAQRVVDIKKFFDAINPLWWIEINGEQSIADVHKEILNKLTTA